MGSFVERLRVPVITFSLCLIVGGCAADEADKAGTPTPSVTPSAVSQDLAEAESATPVAPSALPATARVEVQAASQQYRSFVVKAAAAVANPRAFKQLESVAAGAALTEIQAQAQEYAQSSYTVTGRAIVRSLEVRSVDDQADPTSMVIAVCLDNSKIDVRNEAGDSLRSAMSGSQEPVLNFYELNKTDGTWLVTGHTLPADTTC